MDLNILIAGDHGALMVTGFSAQNVRNTCGLMNNTKMDLTDCDFQLKENTI